MSQDQVWWEADDATLRSWAVQRPDLRPHIAQHPNCSAELRAWIYQSMQADHSQAEAARSEQTQVIPAPGSNQPHHQNGWQSHGQTPPPAPATNPEATNPEGGKRAAGKRRKGLILVILAALIICLAGGLTYLWYNSHHAPASAPTPTAIPTSAPETSASPTAATTPSATTNRPPGWDRIKQWDFANSKLEVAWIFESGRTKAQNVQLHNGRGSGDNASIALTGTPEFADANNDGYLDAFIQVNTEPRSRAGVETRGYLMLWDPVSKQPKQLSWYVTEEGACKGNINSVKATDRGFEISGSIPSRIDPCSSAHDISFTHVIGAIGDYPVRMDKRGWGGVCATDLNSSANLLDSGLNVASMKLAPEEKAPQLMAITDVSQISAVYEAAWYDGKTVIVDGYKQVLIATKDNSDTNDLACAYIPEKTPR